MYGTASRMKGSSFSRSFWFVYLLQLCTASKIQLTASPAHISQGLAETLSLRCSLEAMSPRGKHFEVLNSSDIMKVKAITVSRVKRTESPRKVAKIIQSQRARAYIDLDTIAVNGDLTPATSFSDLMYLELTWAKPDHHQAGIYTCEIIALDFRGRNVVLTSSIEIHIEVPKTEELVNHIVNLTRRIEYLQTSVAKIADLETTDANIQGVLRTLKGPHYETGIVACGHSRYWYGHPRGWPTAKQLVKHVTFDEPYDEPPMVNINVELLDLSTPPNFRYALYVQDVESTGFNIACVTWHDSEVHELILRWTSSVA